MEKNLTEGSISKNLIFFSLPYLLSYFLQTLYGMADLFIIGQFENASVISAVSIGSQIMHMFTVIIVGLAMGSTVLIGQAVGAKKQEDFSKVLGNSIIIFVIFSIFLTFITQIFCPQIIKLVSTPKESLEQTNFYLRICFAGIPFIVAYNVIASIYRGMGDSTSPMIFIIIACVLNIILDVIFIGLFKMKAIGAASATIISQTVSVIISLICFSKSKQKIKLHKTDFKLSKNVTKNILKIGIPVACQDGFIQISFLIITTIANKRGVDIAAAVGIVEKIISFLFLIPSSMLSAISAIGAQNIGAGFRDRAKKTLWLGIKITFTIGLIFAISFQFLAEPVLKLFTRENEVIKLGTQYLKSYVFDCVFAAIHFCFSGYFCALGKSIISFIHNIISVIFVRIPGAYLASKLWQESLFQMGFAPPLGSLLSAIICVISFIIIEKSEKCKN